MASPVCVCLLVGTGHLGMDGGLWIKAISPKGQWMIYVSASEVKARSAPSKGWIYSR